MTAPLAPRAVVIIRIGASHRVSGWAKTPRAARDWDLVLSPYQDIPDLTEFEPDAVIPEAGGKWDALHKVLTGNPDLIDRAPLIWLPDDDIEADETTVSRLFRIAAEAGLALSQPALTPDSQISHFITVRNPLTRLRRTDFVELMVPLMTPDVLRAVLPEMEARPAAKGLDFIWQDFAPEGAVGIVDAAAVGHHRPIGQHLTGRAKAAGIDVDAERDAWIEARVGKWRRPLALGPGGRVGAFAAAAAGLVVSPGAWRKRHALRIAKHLRAQLLEPSARRVPPPG
ncbi:Protein of unknown function [Albimonas donghaensis]|uniref:DUF707 domain-containing protein n=1 Tax=Albimonas donghaensis TaxID=356660 RepID=A0A1H2TSA7_9RHOB|nr:DUF707 domain-containing protein [Albimonas donghaensis]SDW46657.1 Protein of unknown function [Albimonas donghaensis]